MAQAIESRKEWDAESVKPTRELSMLDVFLRERDEQSGKVTKIKDPELEWKCKNDQEGLDMAHKSKLNAWENRKTECKSTKTGAHLSCRC